jgi:pimeloyl-ACP methyl ester carboxylesterase
MRSALAVLGATLRGSRGGSRRDRARTQDLRRTLHLAAPLDTELGLLVAGDPAGTRLILVHGTPGSAQGWADLLLDPPPRVEVVALDRPGFGRSGPRRAVTRLADQAAAVAALLPADGRRAVLLGHSLGGAVVARVAAEQPQRVAALVLVSAALDPGLEKTHFLQPIAALGWIAALLPRAIRHANAELLALRAELDELAGLLGRIDVPVVVLHGQADDLVPVANVAYLRERLGAAPSCTPLLLPGHDHFLPWKAPAEVRAAIARALEAGSC